MPPPKTEPSAPAKQNGPPPPQFTPENRLLPASLVRVRANTHIVETVNGALVRCAPGQEMSIPAARLKALGKQVTPV